MTIRTDRENIIVALFNGMPIKCPAETPLENLKSLVKATREYGKY